MVEKTSLAGCRGRGGTNLNIYILYRWKMCVPSVVHVPPVGPRRYINVPSLVPRSLSFNISSKYFSHFFLLFSLHLLPRHNLCDKKLSHASDQLPRVGSNVLLRPAPEKWHPVLQAPAEAAHSQSILSALYTCLVHMEHSGHVQETNCCRELICAHPPRSTHSYVVRLIHDLEQNVDLFLCRVSLVNSFEQLPFIRGVHESHDRLKSLVGQDLVRKRREKKKKKI